MDCTNDDYENSIRVEHTDGLCNQGRTYRIDCPETDFRKERKRSAKLDARQEFPVNDATTQCYGDIILNPCWD